MDKLHIFGLMLVLGSATDLIVGRVAADEKCSAAPDDECFSTLQVHHALVTEQADSENHSLSSGLSDEPSPGEEEAKKRWMGHSLSFAWQVDPDSIMLVSPGESIFEDAAGDFDNTYLPETKTDTVESESSTEEGNTLSLSMKIEGSYGAFSAAAETRLSSVSKSKHKQFRQDRITVRKLYRVARKTAYPHKKLRESFRRYLMEEPVEKIPKHVGEFFANTNLLGAMFKMSIFTDMFASETKKELAATMQAEYSALGVGAKASAGISASKAKLKSGRSATVSIRVYGGDVEDVKVDNVDATIKAWAETVGWNNSNVIGLKLTPIWELLDHNDMNRTKAAELKQYMLKKWQHDNANLPSYAGVLLHSHRYRLAAKNSRGCPRGYEPLTKEQCMNGVEIPGQEMRPYSGQTNESNGMCHLNDLPRGCFMTPGKNSVVRWTDCPTSMLTRYTRNKWDFLGLDLLVSTGWSYGICQSIPITYVSADVGAYHCPDGYAQVTEEDCRGMTSANPLVLNRKQFTFNAYPNVHFDSTTGCFIHKEKIYWSNRQAPFLSTPTTLGICRLADLPPLVWAARGASRCPQSYVPVPVEECDRGLSYEGKIYHLHDTGRMCPHHWPGGGCFTYEPKSELYKSYCPKDKPLSPDAQHRSLCKQADYRLKGSR